MCLLTTILVLYPYLAGLKALLLFLHISAQASLVIAAECEHFAILCQNNSMHTTLELSSVKPFFSLFRAVLNFNFNCWNLTRHSYIYLQYIVLIGMVSWYPGEQQWINGLMESNLLPATISTASLSELTSPGLDFSMTSSPRPSCPVSPWPTVRTWPNPRLCLK